MWIVATNPLVSFPNQGVLRQALSNLEFLVVQDGYHPTPDHGTRATWCLPAAIWGEKEGTYTNSERRVSKVNKAVEPIGEARPDFDIFLAIAERLGCREELFPGWHGPRGCVRRMAARFRAGGSATTPGISYDCWSEQGAVQWPFPEGATSTRRVAAVRGWPVRNRRRTRAFDLREPGSRFRSSRTASIRWC